MDVRPDPLDETLKPRRPSACRYRGRLNPLAFNGRMSTAGGIVSSRELLS
jgi:hypothetical protein